MTGRIYRFEDVEVDTAQGCVRREGKERHLRHQTFQFLVYLLEQRERLVTKDELLKNIWNGTAVTDDALVQCVMDIRRALGDDSRRPRFIKTIPRIGYRFIGELDTEASSNRAASVSQLSLPSDVVVSGAANRQPQFNEVDPPKYSSLIHNRYTQIAVGCVILALGVGTAIYYRQRSRATRALPDITVSTLGKRSVAVMFFDNQSGNPDLDWLREGLAGMLITDLSRSRNLAVLSRQQLHLLLERIGHNASEGIRLDEALELAQRSQAQIVILGSFARLGEQIRLDVQLHDARDGHLLTAERLVVNQPEQILTQLDLLSLKLASHLGSRSEEQTDRNATVMTNNLEAYRYYSLGVEKSRALQTQEAIALLEKAVQLDPEFAMAYARIGYTYVLTSARIDEGKPYLEKAFKLTHRLSEYDRLNISAWYALANQDYEAAIKSFRDIIERYPLEVEAYQRLGRLLHGEDRFDEAVEILKQGLVIDPGAKELYNSLGSTYSDMGHHDDAIPTYQHYVQLAAQEPNSHDSLGLGYEGAGRYNEAIEEYERALSIKPDFQVSTIHLANALTRLGRYREAIEKYRRFNELVQVPRERSRGYTSIARVQVLRGNLVDAEKAARQANLQEKQSVDGFLFVAFAKADQAMAKRALETYETSNHPDRGSRFSLRRVLYYRGQVALLERRHEEAIALFKDALRHRPLIWDGDAQEDCLANAYLTLGMLDESTAEYERILKLNPNYPLVHYHLGQIYERKGQREKARAEYQQFLTVWEKADADIPEVVAAKKVLGSA